MLYRGPYRPLSKRDEVTAEAVAEILALAKANMERGQLKEALFDLDSALCLMPKSLHAHCNRAQALLSLGDYVEGFKEFEWRLSLFGDPLAVSGVPLWGGQELVGRRLLLYHEHGYGDSLMMLRYVPVLKAMGAIITLLLPPALVLLAQQFDVEVQDKYPGDLSGFDYRCPMFSVIARLNHSVADIPPAPYIATVGGEGRIPNSTGIAWSGNRSHLRDKFRSVGIDQFLSLLEAGGRELFSVQDSERDEARERGVITPNYRHFADTTGFIARLDHVVTVDTAAAHLAGAIGHPSVHVLLPYSPDWRWYNGQAWYPKMKLHRQDAPGDWASAFAKVNKCLSA